MRENAKTKMDFGRNKSGAFACRTFFTGALLML